MLDRVSPFGKDVAPTDDELAVEGDELSRLGGIALPHETPDLLQRKCLDLREVLLLAGDRIETGVKALRMRLGDPNDIDAIQQRHRRQAT